MREQWNEHTCVRALCAGELRGNIGRTDVDTTDTLTENITSFLWFFA